MYTFQRLPDDEHAFRIAEILPGEKGSTIECRLHLADWDNIVPYEAISYAWGDPSEKKSIVCDGELLGVTKSLHTALDHLRFRDRSRFLWADVIWLAIYILHKTS